MSHVQLTKKKMVITNSIYYAIFHNHLKVGNPKGIRGKPKNEKHSTKQ